MTLAEEIKRTHQSFMKSRRRFFAAVFGLILLFQSSCTTQRHIKHYSGDGEIKALPYYGFLWGGGGCVVKFKPIKLDHPAQFTYRFTGLPEWHFNCFFVIEDSRDWQDRKTYEDFLHDRRMMAWAKTNHVKFATYDDLNGTLDMCLKDAEGNVLFQFSRKLSELTWSTAGPHGPAELWDYDAKTWFKADRTAKYILEVRIDPDPTLKDDDGYVLIRGGGHEGVSIGF